MTQERIGSGDPSAAETGESGEPFGAAMERLEGIVARLEGDETLGLEEALALYEQGVALAGECRRRLDRAQLTLTSIDVRPPDEPDAEPDPDGDSEG